MELISLDFISNQRNFVYMKAGVDKTLLLFVIIQRTVQSINKKMSPLIREDGLTVGQWDTLNVLYTNGPMTVNGLINKLLTSSGNIDVVITNLIKRGEKSDVCYSADSDACKQYQGFPAVLGFLQRQC